jgi:N utilization substance protein B
MRRSDAREIAMRVIFAVFEGGVTASWALETIFDDTYYASLAAEDKAFSARPSARQRNYIDRVVNGVYAHADELNEYMGKYSVGWRIERVSRVASAIIKMAMFEALYIEDVPTASAINEAVELGKRYVTPETVAYINGVLGSFSRSRETPAEG